MKRKLAIAAAAVIVALAVMVAVIASSFTAVTAAGGCQPGPVPGLPRPSGHWTQREIAALWVHTGGPRSQARVAGAVGMAESRGDPDVVNHIGAGGLMQIHPPEPGYLDPQVNMRIALRKWRAGGWQPWEAYTGPDGVGADGPYLEFMDGSRAPPSTAGQLPDGCLGAAGQLVGGTGAPVKLTGEWLVTVPGTGARCDARIVRDVQQLMSAYRLLLGDCFALTGHSSAGEHPLGLGLDAYPDPAKGGTWDDVDRLARWAEPTQDRPIEPFRWVGYDGDVNHGRGHHIHLSWKHSPAAFNTPAELVWTLRTPGSGSARAGTGRSADASAATTARTTRSRPAR